MPTITWNGLACWDDSVGFSLATPERQIQQAPLREKAVGVALRCANSVSGPSDLKRASAQKVASTEPTSNVLSAASSIRSVGSGEPPMLLVRYLVKWRNELKGGLPRVTLPSWIINSRYRVDFGQDFLARQDALVATNRLHRNSEAEEVCGRGDALGG